MINNLKPFLYLAAAGILAVGITSCGDTKPKPEDDENKIDSTQANFVKIDKAVFSIPSPYQTALLIKQVGAPYSKDLLNPVKNLQNYSTNFKKALNLGLYGADLGYVAIYEQNQDAISYLGTTQKLASDLGVASAFDAKLIGRFQKNLGNKDSLLNMVSLAFRTGNNYLQSNERKDVAGLIIAGGFVESLYLTVNIAQSNKNPEVLNRIGEQKSSLENLIKLLTPYYEQAEYTEFLDQLIDLAYDFDAIEAKYTFIAPTTDEANKVTTINSTSELIITNEQLEQISKKVKAIRAQIIG